MTIEEYLSGKNVLIFGLGAQGGGVGDAIFCHKIGASVRVTDLKSEEKLKDSVSSLPGSITLSLGGHKKEDIDWADIIIKNPGVPSGNEFLSYARREGKRIESSSAIFLDFTKSKTIAVTGTRGKSTTTELIHHILSSSGLSVSKGGNIRGTSMLSLLEDEKEYTVLELSSFQLESFHDRGVSPHISVVTNIYQDHLNRYDSMESYIKDKLAIVMYQDKDDHTILNKKSEYMEQFMSSTRGQVHWFDSSETPSNLMGEHNKENVAAAEEVANVLGISQDKSSSAVMSFSPLPYRLEKVGEAGGVAYINDTTSTTPTATIMALQSFTDPVILIMGGEEKNLDTSDLEKYVSNPEHVKSLIILGSKNNEAVKRIAKTTPYKTAMSMEEAVTLARGIAKKNDTVLLSPGFASFDLFDNEFDRGDQFNREVKKLLS